MRRIYLDNAATSFPKPPGVYRAMLRYATRVGASPGRGQYAESREGARIIRQCRERLNRLINGENPDHIIFTLNTTDALNLAIKGAIRARRLVEPASPLHVVTTAMDHNSVLRPFRALADEGIEVTHVAADPATGVVDAAAVAQALRPHTVLAAVLAASNVSGAIQPVAAIGDVCRRAGVLFLVDAAQALGHIPADVRDLRADLLAFPGHKGLLGPQGTGGLYVRPGVENRLATTREGGTGAWSESDRHPDAMPQRFEAGSHNTIGIAGLAAAAAWLLDRGIDSVRRHELALIREAIDTLREGGCRIEGGEPGSGPYVGLRLLGPGDADSRVGVFAFTHDALDPAEMAAILEQQFGVLVRSGLTCAPMAHDTFGTSGALRMSIGPFTTRDDLLAALSALRDLCATVSEPLKSARWSPAP